MARRSYYSMLERIDGKWTIQFGDYDKQVVLDEMRDQRESEPKICLKMINTTADQGLINAAVAKLNGE
jgi:hypothetical protein